MRTVRPRSDPPHPLVLPLARRGTSHDTNLFSPRSPNVLPTLPSLPSPACTDFAASTCHLLQARGLALGGMAPTRHADEGGGRLELTEAERIEEEDCFESIEKLISEGISAGDVKKLQDAGVYTFNGLMMHTKKSLTRIKGLSEAKVEKICEAAEKLLQKLWWSAHEGGGPLEVTEADRIEEEEDCYVYIDELISQGINAGDVKRLHDAGINTCNALMVYTKENLTGINGLSKAKVEKICEATEKLLSQRLRRGNDLLIKSTTRSQDNDSREAKVPEQSSEAHTSTSAVAESILRPLPAAVMDNLEPFARLVKLIARGFYSDVGISKGEVKTGCNDNCGIAVVVLNSLTRYAWVNEKDLAKLLKIKEKTMFPLIQFLEKEMFLKRENIERAHIKIGDATVTASGRYCCLDYSQVYDVIRYRLHRMKESLKDEHDCGNRLEEQIESYICRICKQSYSALDVMHLLSNSGDTFHCEICNDELVARKDLDGPRKERRKKFAGMVKRMKEQFRPLEEQLSMLKDVSVPDFRTLKEWMETNIVEYIAQIKVESPISVAEQDDVECSSSLPGSKVLTTWIIRKGMTLKKSEKVSNHSERQVGIKSKRGEDDDVISQVGGSIRRRI